MAKQQRRPNKAATTRKSTASNTRSKPKPGNSSSRKAASARGARSTELRTARRQAGIQASPRAETVVQGCSGAPNCCQGSDPGEAGEPAGCTRSGPAASAGPEAWLLRGRGHIRTRRSGPAASRFRRQRPISSGPSSIAIRRNASCSNARVSTFACASGRPRASRPGRKRRTSGSMPPPSR